MHIFLTEDCRKNAGIHKIHLRNKQSLFLALVPISFTETWALKYG